MKSRTLLAATTGLSLAVLTELNATIIITRQLADQRVSVGAHVTNQVTVSSTAPPITFEWRGPSSRLLTGETNRTSVTLELVLPSIQANQAGGYYVVLSDTDNVPVQSATATITVDPTFIKITEGPLVTTVDRNHNATWSASLGRRTLTQATTAALWTLTRTAGWMSSSTSRPGPTDSRPASIGRRPPERSSN